MGVGYDGDPQFRTPKGIARHLPLTTRSGGVPLLAPLVQADGSPAPGTGSCLSRFLTGEARSSGTDLCSDAKRILGTHQESDPCASPNAL